MKGYVVNTHKPNPSPRLMLIFVDTILGDREMFGRKINIRVVGRCGDEVYPTALGTLFRRLNSSTNIICESSRRGGGA